MVSADESTFRSDPSRRRLLAAGGVGLAASLAGCVGIRTDTLTGPETVDEDDRMTLHYDVNGNRIAEVSVIERWLTTPDTAPYRITLAVRQPGDTRLERIRYELRPKETDFEPEFALVRPGGHPWEPIEFARGEGAGTTVLSVPDLGAQGSGTTSLSLLVEPNTTAEFELRIGVGGALEEEGLLGRTYELEGELVRTLPGYEQLSE